MPDSSEIEVQIGLYYLALEQTYRQSLKYLSLLFLRSGEKIRFKATRDHQERVQKTISKRVVSSHGQVLWHNLLMRPKLATLQNLKLVARKGDRSRPS